MLIGVIGAGPIGIHMACKLSKHSIPFIIFEKGQVGQTIFNWPIHTRFNSAPEKIAIGSLPIIINHQEKLKRDEYLSYLRQVIIFYKLNIHLYEEVIQIEKIGENFQVQTINIHLKVKTYFFTHLIMATGSCHNQLIPEIPGIDKNHIKDTNFPLHFTFKQNIFIIGGRHSALEFAIKACRIGANNIAICSRSDPFDAKYLKKEILEEVRMLIDSKKIILLSSSEVKEIKDHSVIVESCLSKEEREVTTDWVILACGFITSFKLFKQLGVDISPLNGAPLVNSSTLETNIKNIYVIGTALAGNQQSQYEYYISNTLYHVEQVIARILKTF